VCLSKLVYFVTEYKKTLTLLRNMLICCKLQSVIFAKDIYKMYVQKYNGGTLAVFNLIKLIEKVEKAVKITPPLGARTFSITTFSKMTLSIRVLLATLSKNNSQHEDTWHKSIECSYAGCLYAECHVFLLC
jgi:hypothetical protein